MGRRDARKPKKGKGHHHPKDRESHDSPGPEERESHDPPGRQKTEMQVLRIPDDGTPPYVIMVDMIDVSAFGNSDEIATKTKLLEDSLGYVPDLSRFGKYFSIDYRGLWNENLRVDNTGPTDWGPYYIYKCWEKKAGLPKNHFFSDVKNARVFGDAFVFNLKWIKPINGDDVPIFGEMMEFERRSRYKGEERGLLKRMGMW